MRQSDMPGIDGPIDGAYYPPSNSGSGSNNDGWSGSDGSRRGGSPMPGVGSNENSASGSAGSAYDNAIAVSDYMDAYNQAQVDAVNAFNAKEAQKNRDWQERMARNAHQYEVEDLIKAGLNPVLSAGGQGAFVGSGAVASGQKAVADNTRAQAALALLNNSLYSAGRVAAAVAKRGTPKEAEESFKMTLSDGIKIAGIFASLSRTATNAWQLAKGYSTLLAGGFAAQMAKKRRQY